VPALVLGVDTSSKKSASKTRSSRTSHKADPIPSGVPLVDALARVGLRAPVRQAGLSVQIAELDTGNVIFEKNSQQAETIASVTKTPDLGVHSGTTEFTGAVVDRIRTKLDVWSSLGS